MYRNKSFCDDSFCTILRSKNKYIVESVSTRSMSSIIQPQSRYAIINLRHFQLSMINRAISSPTLTWIWAAHIVCLYFSFDYVLLNGIDDRIRSLFLSSWSSSTLLPYSRNGFTCSVLYILARFRVWARTCLCLQDLCSSGGKTKTTCIIAPRSVIMSPNMLGVTTVSTTPDSWQTTSLWHPRN